VKALEGSRRQIAATNSAVVLGVLALLAAALWHLHLDDYQIPFSYSDLLPRWAGTRLALEGVDPYNDRILSQLQSSYHVTAQPFLYPAQVVLFLLPLAPLTLRTAQIVFLVTVTPLFAWSLWLAMQTLGLPASRRVRVWVLLLACVSWPAMWALRLQQFSLLVAALVFIAWSLIARGRQVVPGALLALTTIKPQLILPLLIWLLLWAILHRRWILLGSFAATLAIVLAITARIVPGWVPHWLTSIQNYSDLRHTAPPLLAMLGHRAGMILTGAVALGAALASLRLLRCQAHSPRFFLALGLLLGVTLCVVSAAPTMIYNDVLLFPACMILVFARMRDRFANAFRAFALLLLCWDFATVPIAATAELLLRPSSFWKGFPFLDLALPVLVTLGLSTEVLRRPALEIFPADARAVTPPQI
jgi:hypothetical protein